MINRVLRANNLEKANIYPPSEKATTQTGPGLRRGWERDNGEVRKFLRIVSWVILTVFVAFVVLVATVYVRGFPPTIRLETSGKDIIVHMETLADYPTHIDRIVITKGDDPDQTVLEAVSYDNAQIHRFTIHAGTNQFGVIRPNSGTYKMLIPNGKSFVLLSNENYRIKVCEADKCSSAHFTLK